MDAESVQDYGVVTQDQATDRSIIPRLPPLDYHKRPEVSSSGIRTFAMEGPLMYEARYVSHTVETTATHPKRLGTAFHLAMSDPEDWFEQVDLIPTVLYEDDDWALMLSEWRGRTKKPLNPGTKIDLKVPAHRMYVQLKRERAEQNGNAWLNDTEMDVMRAMIRSVYDNPAATEYVGKRHQDNVELACFANDHKTGLGIKALADLYLDDTIVDFKTTKCTTANAFIREALHKYSYQYQAEWYLRTFGASEFVIISVRNEPPFESMVYRVPAHILSTVREANDYHLAALRDCYDTQSWNSLMWGAEIPLDDKTRFPQ